MALRAFSGKKTMARVSSKAGWYDRGFKRALDFLLALVLVALLLPLMLLITLLLLVCRTSRPVFRQQRVGYLCRTFYIYKFRTMTDARNPETGELLPDEARTTWIGRLLRATSLDELPELFNILLGDMSFIGPRPWVPEQMATFAEHTRRLRQSMRPGLSGLAQICGRNNLTFRQRVCLDLRYIRRHTPWLDLGIFFATFYKVIMREGIYQRPDPTAHAPKDPATRGLRANRTRRKYK